MLYLENSRKRPFNTYQIKRQNIETSGPNVEAVRRNAQTVRYFGNGITAFRYLTDGFFLKFRCSPYAPPMLKL